MSSRQLQYAPPERRGIVGHEENEEGKPGNVPQETPGTNSNDIIPNRSTAPAEQFESIQDAHAQPQEALPFRMYSPGQFDFGISGLTQHVEWFPATSPAADPLNSSIYAPMLHPPRHGMVHDQTEMAQADFNPFDVSNSEYPLASGFSEYGNLFLNQSLNPFDLYQDPSQQDPCQSGEAQNPIYEQVPRSDQFQDVPTRSDEHPVDMLQISSRPFGAVAGGPLIWSETLDASWHSSQHIRDSNSYSAAADSGLLTQYQTFPDLHATIPKGQPEWEFTPEPSAHLTQSSMPKETASDSDIGLEWLFETGAPALENHTSTGSTTSGHNSKERDTVKKLPAKSKGRKTIRSPSPTDRKRTRTQESISYESCLISFAVESGEVQKRRPRPKLEAKARKELTLQRNAGACHQCRFRKRACALNTPCDYCKNLAGSLSIGSRICYRDSPFTYQISSDYFLYTSGKRIVNFFCDLPKDTSKKIRTIFVRPNERGFYAGPLQLQVYDCDMDTLPKASRDALLSKSVAGAGKNKSKKVTIIDESDESLGERLENWALEYGTAFAKTQNERAGRLLLIGRMYVERELPESNLVWTCVRIHTMNYVLRTGVAYCATKPTNPNRAVEARIDTILYNRLKQAEKKLNGILERIVWKSYGRLTRQQLFPVAYVLWQYIRLTCLRVSHVTNIAIVYKYKGLEYGPISSTLSEMAHMYNLLLSVHTALFRSSSPLKLDFSDHFQRDILDGDEKLIDEATQVKRINNRVRNASYGRFFRSVRAYERQTTDKMRKVLDGEGLKF